MELKKQADSISSFLCVIKEIVNDWGPGQNQSGELWFRGASHAKYDLIPGLYRLNDTDELALFDTFRTLGISLVRNRPTDEWEWYFLAQHHRLPTRLLDWTDSALAALYFALHDHVEKLAPNGLDANSKKNQSGVYNGNSPIVWLLDAGSLNQHSFGDDYVYTPGGEFTKHYLPEFLSGRSQPKNFTIRNREWNNNMPIALYPYRSHDRIVAQQGTFTVHGFCKTPINCLTSDSIKLAQIIFDTSSVATLWKELELLGVRRYNMFPELDSIAKYLQWNY